MLVGTQKGAFILTSDAKRTAWDVHGPLFAGWEIYHMNGSHANPDRLYASQSNGWFGQARRNQTRKWMHEIIQQGLMQQFESHPAIRKRLEAIEQDVLEGRTTSFRAARTLLDIYAGSKH